MDARRCVRLVLVKGGVRLVPWPAAERLRFVLARSVRRCLMAGELLGRVELVGLVVLPTVNKDGG